VGANKGTCNLSVNLSSNETYAIQSTQTMAHIRHEESMESSGEEMPVTGEGVDDMSRPVMALP
jgi:hypothetical protein